MQLAGESPPVMHKKRQFVVLPQHSAADLEAIVIGSECLRASLSQMDPSRFYETCML